MPTLTIGMASFNNFHEVWFTVQALRLYQDLTDTEILVIDNYGDDGLQKFIEGWTPEQIRYERYTERQGTAAPRDEIFKRARGTWVLCIDSHVMLPQGTIARFREWCTAHQDCTDLIQGPMLYDDLKRMADAFNDVWDGSMWGTWRNAALSPEADPYEIPMMGLGLFACRRDAWLGFNQDHRGFGAEEGYIHEKFRQAGRKTISLPFLRWVHYFQTRDGKLATNAPYVPRYEDKIHNYLVSFAELGLDTTPIYAHFNLAESCGRCGSTKVIGLTPPQGQRVPWYGCQECGADGPTRHIKNPSHIWERRGRLDVPIRISNIQIDPNANCGSKCWFCPVRYIERPPGQVMPQPLFERLLDGIQDGIERGSIERNVNLWLSSYNDILLDPLLPERLQALRSRSMRFTCLTNGLALLKHHRLLHEYRDVIGCYSVDLPAGNPESYAHHTLNAPEAHQVIIEGLKVLHALDPAHYSQVVHIGVNGFHEAEWNRNQLRLELPQGDTDTQIQQLKDLLPMYPRIEGMRPLCDRAGYLKEHAIDNGIHRPDTTGCKNLTEWLYVNSFGRAYTCCQDYREEYQYADLTVLSIHEALTNKPKGPFEATRRDLCSKCTFSH